MMFPPSYEAAVVLVCIALCAVVIAVSMRHKLGLVTGAVMAALSCVLCMVCARGYYLLVAGPGFRFRLFPDTPYDYGFGGGVLGFLAALYLTALITRKPFARVSDAFAPVGLLGIAGLRMAEALSDFGWGDMLDTPWLQRYPFAIPNMYDEWCSAVFNLEALCALVILAVLLIGGEKLKGRRLATGLVWWAVSQVFCESLRVESITWGFIRVQQLLSAVIVMVVMLVGTLRLAHGKRKQTLPLWGGYVFSCGMVIFLEFAIDKMPWPTWVNYLVMALVLILLGTCAQKLIHKPSCGKE